MEAIFKLISDPTPTLFAGCLMIGMLLILWRQHQHARLLRKQANSDRIGDAPEFAPLAANDIGGWVIRPEVKQLEGRSRSRLARPTYARARGGNG